MSQKKKSRPSAGTWAWFKLYNAEWSTDDTAALDYGSLGFLFELHCRMVGTEVPISYDVILRISRSRGLNRRTVDKMLETLTDCGLIYLTEDGYWRDEAGRVVDELAEVSQKISKRNTNLSRKRWQKNEQNQENSIPEEDIEVEAAAPSGQAAITNTVEVMETTSMRGLDGRMDAPDAQWGNDYVGPSHPDDFIIEPEKRRRPSTDPMNSRCHIYEQTCEATAINNADTNAIIVTHDIAESYFERYLGDYLSSTVVDRMMSLLKAGQLTAGTVKDAIAAARESYNGNQKTA